MIDIERGSVINFDYVNWRGEKANRTIEVLHIRYGSTEWHPEDGFIITGGEHRTGIRHFAAKDMTNVKVIE